MSAQRTKRLAAPVRAEALRAERGFVLTEDSWGWWCQRDGCDAIDVGPTGGKTAGLRSALQHEHTAHADLHPEGLL